MDGFASQTLKTLRSLYEAAFSVANRAPAFDGVSTRQPSSIALHEVVPTGYRVDHAGEARRFGSPATVIAAHRRAYDS